MLRWERQNPSFIAYRKGMANWNWAVIPIDYAAWNHDDNPTMPLLTIHHKTEYRYTRPVAFGEHRIMLRPRDGHDLRVPSLRARHRAAADAAALDPRRVRQFGGDRDL